jgi:hypothetical protein
MKTHVGVDRKTTMESTSVIPCFQQVTDITEALKALGLFAYRHEKSRYH